MTWTEKAKKNRADKIANDPAYRERVNALKRNARRRAKGLPLEPIPDGFKADRITTVVDAEGNTAQQSIRATPAGDVPFAPLPKAFELKRLSTLSNPHGPILQWTIAKPEERERWDAFWAAAKENAAEYDGRAAPVLAPDSERVEDTETHYPLGDPHIGLLAWAQETGSDFDLHIARRELLGAVSHLTSMAPASRTGVLVNLGDFYHAQDDKQLTPHAGHKLDVDGRSSKVHALGQALQVAMVEMLLAKHERVIVHNLPGNHDPMMAFLLESYLSAWFRHEPRVEVRPSSDPFQVREFGRVFHMWNHGDGVHPKDLAGIMAAYDDGQPWGRTRYRYGVQGHRHQKIVIEKPGALVEVFRTLAGRDHWSHWKGFRSGQSLEAITYSPEFGEISRVTCDVTMARKAAV